MDSYIMKATERQDLATPTPSTTIPVPKAANKRRKMQGSLDATAEPIVQHPKINASRRTKKAAQENVYNRILHDLIEANLAPSSSQLKVIKELVLKKTVQMTMNGISEGLILADDPASFEQAVVIRAAIEAIL